MTVDVTAVEFREYVKGVAFRARVTQRELSVLKIASEGRTSDEFARILGLGTETVRPMCGYEQLAREGYQQNAVVHACILLIARAVADIPWVMYQGRAARNRRRSRSACSSM